MSDSLTPKLSEVLDAAIEGALEGVRVALPGRIEHYDKDTRRATVQLLVQDGHVDGDGERQTTTIAPLTDVPVMMHGSGTVRVKIPIRVGDPCWVLFASSSIAKVKTTDGATVIDPADDRHHHESDAVVIPIPSLAAGSADDDAMIEFTDDGLIKAGGDEPLVKRSEFLAHTHATAGTGTPSPPITGPAGSAATFPGTGKLRA
jgi:hypothetical protein